MLQLSCIYANNKLILIHFSLIQPHSNLREKFSKIGIQILPFSKGYYTCFKTKTNVQKGCENRPQPHRPSSNRKYNLISSFILLP